MTELLHYDLIRMVEPGKWCVVTIAVDPVTREGELVDARYCREHELPTGDVVWTDPRSQGERTVSEDQGGRD